MIQTKFVEKIRTYTLFSTYFFPKVVTFERCTCWTNKVTDTHSEYVIRNAFPGQQWSRERASLGYFTGTMPVLLYWKYHPFALY